MFWKYILAMTKMQFYQFLRRVAKKLMDIWIYPVLDWHCSVNFSKLSQWAINKCMCVLFSSSLCQFFFVCHFASWWQLCDENCQTLPGCSTSLRCFLLSAQRPLPLFSSVVAIVFNQTSSFCIVARFSSFASASFGIVFLNIEVVSIFVIANMLHVMCDLWVKVSGCTGRRITFGSKVTSTALPLRLIALALDLIL